MPETADALRAGKALRLTSGAELVGLVEEFIPFVFVDAGQLVTWPPGPLAGRDRGGLRCLGVKAL